MLWSNECKVQGKMSSHILKKSDLWLMSTQVINMCTWCTVGQMLDHGMITGVQKHHHIWPLCDRERSTSRSLRFQSLLSWKGAELGHILLLNIHRNMHWYGESSGVVTFDLEWPWRSNSRSLRFRSPISRQVAELGHMLLLNINRKPYTHVHGESNGTITFDLE